MGPKRTTGPRTGSVGVTFRVRVCVCVRFALGSFSRVVCCLFGTGDDVVSLRYVYTAVI